MYICICKSVTDHEIKTAVAEGINSFPELSETLGCSTQCGKCERIAQKVMNKALTEQSHCPGSSVPTEIAVAAA
ncbi:MAG: (2Fe-2S)-binding protein [Pseudomonadota bacterium]